MNDQNLSVWIATIDGRRHVYYRLSDGEVRHLGPLEEVRILIEKLNAILQTADLEGGQKARRTMQWAGETAFSLF